MSKEIRSRFGKKIRQLRVKKGLTQNATGGRVGMAAASYRALEAVRKEPCLGTIEALAPGSECAVAPALLGSLVRVQL